MAVKYYLTKNNNSESAGYGKWYANVVIDETYDIQKLARHMADHNTPYSRGIILGVLTDMVHCIKELCLNGIAVKIEDLAIFSVGLESIGAPTPADFSVAKHIKALKLRARATGEFTKNQLTNFSEATIQETHKNAVNTSKPESVSSEETENDNTGGGSSGSNDSIDQNSSTENPSGGSENQGGDSGIG